MWPNRASPSRITASLPEAKGVTGRSPDNVACVTDRVAAQAGAGAAARRGLRMVAAQGFEPRTKGL